MSRGPNGTRSMSFLPCWQGRSRTQSRPNVSDTLTTGVEACFLAASGRPPDACCAVTCCHRLVESHPGGIPTVEDGAELRPEWRAWIDHSLRYTTQSQFSTAFMVKKRHWLWSTHLSSAVITSSHKKYFSLCDCQVGIVTPTRC